MRYAHSIFARRGFVLGLFFAALCMTRPVLAIEKYAAVPLPDDGLGSTTRSLTKEGSGTLAVVGSKQKGDGTLGAMYWSITADPSDPSGNTVVATELPKPPGMSAWATGIAFAGGNPDLPIICGYTGATFINGGSLRAVIWRRNASGQFVNTTFDDQAAVANAIIARDTPLGLIIVVCGKFQLTNGEWHACLWRISNQGTQRTDLGTLGGPLSEAMAILYVGGDGGVFRVVGSAQRRNGRTLATSWIIISSADGGLRWFVQALPTPPGAESNAVYVGSANGGVWKSSGWITEANGRRSASVWINQDESPNAFVSQLYRDVLGRGGDTTANGIVDYIDQDDLVVGTRRNSAGRQRGGGALPFNQAFDDPFFFDALRARDPVLDWNSIALNAVEPGGAIAGEALFSGAATSQAALFLPTNTEVPQITTVLVGYQIGPDITNRISNLWQEDGNALRFAPQHNAQGDRISIEFTSAGVSAGSSRAPQRLTLVSSIMPRHPNPNSPLTLTLQLYDPAFGVWITVGNRILSASTYGRGLFFRSDFDVPNPDRFAVSAGQPLRWRVGLRGEEWKDFDVDLIEMEVEKMP